MEADNESVQMLHRRRKDCPIVNILSCGLDKLWKHLFSFHYSMFFRTTIVLYNSSQVLFKNGPSPASFQFIFVFSKLYLNFYNKCMRKNVHPIYSAGIQTHNFQNMSLLSITTRQGLPPSSEVLTRYYQARYNCKSSIASTSGHPGQGQCAIQLLCPSVKSIQCVVLNGL